MGRTLTAEDYIPLFLTDSDRGLLGERITKGKTAPLYIYRSVVNTKEITAWAKEQGFDTVVDPAQLHVTVVYSKAPVDWFSLGESWQTYDKGEITINPGGPRTIEKFGEGAIVLCFSSNDLTWRNEQAREKGASWDWPEYSPHITISYSGADMDLEAIKPYTGKIVLGPEMFEPIKENWKDTVVEKTMTVPITKTQDDQMLVFGWAYVCEENGQQVVDHSGEAVDEAELEKAFYDFVENVGLAGENHEEIGVGKLVECIVFTKEKQKVLGIDLGKVGVWTGFRLNEKTYAKVKSGEYKMLSFGARAIPVEYDAAA